MLLIMTYYYKFVYHYFTVIWHKENTVKHVRECTKHNVPLFCFWRDMHQAPLANSRPHKTWPQDCNRRFRVSGISRSFCYMTKLDKAPSSSDSLYINIRPLFMSGYKDIHRLHIDVKPRFDNKIIVLNISSLMWTWHCYVCNRGIILQILLCNKRLRQTVNGRLP